MLHKGFTPQQILQHHIQLVQRGSMEGTLQAIRDIFLTLRDILNVASKLEMLTLQANVDDACSVHNWGQLQIVLTHFSIKSLTMVKGSHSHSEFKQIGNWR